MNKFGQMEVIMKENGLMIKPMVLEDLYILMEMSMKVIGLMIRLMDMESINILMEQNLKVNGLKIYKMEKALKLGKGIANHGFAAGCATLRNPRKRPCNHKTTHCSCRFCMTLLTPRSAQLL